MSNWQQIKDAVQENIADDHWGWLVTIDRTDFDKIAAVVDAAKKEHPDLCCGHCDICEALENLEK